VWKNRGNGCGYTGGIGDNPSKWGNVAAKCVEFDGIMSFFGQSFSALLTCLVENPVMGRGKAREINSMSVWKGGKTRVFNRRGAWI